MSVLVPAALLTLILLQSRDGDDAGPTTTVPTPVTDIAPFDPAKARTGEPAPDFALPDLGGSTVRLSQFRGTPVVLTFFASWCNPCEEELPALEAVQRDAGSALQVLAVNYRDFAKDSREFARRLGITYPALIEDATTNPVAELYGVRGIPVTFFIAADGTFAHPPLFGEGTREALQPGLDALRR